MLVRNATNETITVKALGNFFEFKPKQIKNFNDNVGMFLINDRRDSGLVHVPDIFFDDPEHKNSEAGKAELEAIDKRGIENFCAALRKRIYNNQVSLRQDLERANIKADPAAFATDGEMEALRTLAKYQAKQEDVSQKRAEEVKKLMKEISSK